MRARGLVGAAARRGRRASGLAPMLTPLASSMNPVDLTPGSMTNPKNRENMPEVLDILAQCAPAPISICVSRRGSADWRRRFADMFETVREGDEAADRTELAGAAATASLQRLADARRDGVHRACRLIRAAGHLARYAADLRHRIRVVPTQAPPFPWDDARTRRRAWSTEDVVARILEDAGLPVAPRRHRDDRERGSQAADRRRASRSR